MLTTPAESWPCDADAYIAEQCGLECALDEALSRLAARGTWKVWRSHLDGAECYDAEEYRRHVVVSEQQMKQQG